MVRSVRGHMAGVAMHRRLTVMRMRRHDAAMRQRHERTKQDDEIAAHAQPLTHRRHRRKRQAEPRTVYEALTRLVSGSVSNAAKVRHETEQKLTAPASLS